MPKFESERIRNYRCERAMPQGKPSISKVPAAVQRYGLAVLSVATALGAAFLLERYHFRDVEFPT
jgi:hypothetical protein